MNVYANKYGATFYVNGNSYHTFRDWGLYPNVRPVINAAKPKMSFVPIPGGDGSLDLSDALTGYVTYETRKGTFTYAAPNRKKWDVALTAVSNTIHGLRCDIVKDEEPDMIYRGRVYVDSVKSDERKLTIVLTGQLEPFKYEVIDSEEDWLWDPFNFHTGVIRNYKNIAVSGTKTVTVISTPIGGSPVFTASAAMTMTYDGNSYSLTSGENIFPEIELPHAVEEVQFTFSGNGTVSINFRGGCL